MNTRFWKIVFAGVIAVLYAAQALGVPLVSPDFLAGGGIAAGAAFMIGDTVPTTIYGEPVHNNVLQLFKNIPWATGVNPEEAIKIVKRCLFKAAMDANNKPLQAEFGKAMTVPNALSLEKLQELGVIQKAFNQPSTATSGLAQYDLEQGARLLYPLTTIFRNMIPRLTGGRGIQANWRSVTAINPTNLNIGLSEGHRGGFMSQTVVDKTAAFKTSGIDNYVTEQAYLAGVTFEDLLALAAITTLQGTMEGEEKIDIGGNGTLSLGTTGTPTVVTGGTTGGYLSDATYRVICVALTYFGQVNSTAPTITASTGALAGGGIALPYTRTNADGSTDYIAGFSAIQSAVATVVMSGGGTTQKITASVTPTNGALGYAWFMGVGAGNERLVMITGYPTASLLNTNSTGQLASAVPASASPADPSINPLNYDGMITQMLTSGSGSYVRDLGGAAFTTSGSGSGGCAEIDAAIVDRYENYRLVPTDIFVSGYDQNALGKLLLTGNTNLAPFFMANIAANGLSGSTVLKKYINPIGYGQQELDVHAHPFIPRGTCILYSRTNPYPISNVPQIIRKLCRRDYWQVDWPVVTLNRTMGVYFDAVLQMYFTPAFGVITGIKN